MPDQVTSLLKTLCSSMVLKCKSQLHRTALPKFFPIWPTHLLILKFTLNWCLFRPLKSVSTNRSTPAGTNSTSMAVFPTTLKECQPLQILRDPKGKLIFSPNELLEPNLIIFKKKINKGRGKKSFIRRESTLLHMEAGLNKRSIAQKA